MSQPPGPLVIRADAGPASGVGHVMRCLALAQAWQDRGGEVTFLTTTDSPTLKDRLCAEGMNVADLAAEPGSPRDIRATVELLARLRAAWVVADGYRFGTVYQQAVKDAGRLLLVVDDYGHADQYVCDLLLNQNLHAEERLYPKRHRHTDLLLGPRHALLRREFWPAEGGPQETADIAAKVLITLGGGDPAGVAAKVLQAFQEPGLEEFEATVVTGALGSHCQQLEAVEHGDIRIEHDPRNMRALMAWADMAVSAAGSTCWELARMGLPSILIILAENQRPIAESLQAAGVAQCLGWGERLSPGRLVDELLHIARDRVRRSRMSHLGRQLVDGHGAARVVEAMMKKAACVNPRKEKPCASSAWQITG